LEAEFGAWFVWPRLEEANCSAFPLLAPSRQLCERSAQIHPLNQPSNKLAAGREASRSWSWSWSWSWSLRWSLSH